MQPIGALTFQANPTALNEQTVTVGAADDATVEGNHSATITHSATGGGYDGLVVSAVSVSITDNDLAYALAGTASVIEGNEGTTGPITYTVTRAGDITRTSSVDFALGGTATFAQDYAGVTPPAGTLTFAPGETQKTITGTVLGDFVDESDETIQVSLSNATGTNANGTAVVTGPATAATTIFDDDAAGLSVGPTSLALSEPAGTASFTITLTSRPTATVTIVLTSSDTSECTVPGSVDIDPSDWTGGAPVAVTVVDDGITDGAQPCTVQTGATSADPVYEGRAVADVDVTVNDDDVKGVVLSESAAQAEEGGATGTYTVRLNAIPTGTVTVNLSTGTQLQPVAALIFPADAGALTPQSVTVAATDDTDVEGDHGATIGHSATGGGYDGLTVGTVGVSIIDNDMAYTLAGTASVIEGGEGMTWPAAYTVTRAGDITRTSSVDFGLGGTATMGEDYADIVPPAGTLTFAAGETQKTITGTVQGDYIDEDDETIEVSLSNATGTNPNGTAGPIGPATTTTTIVDDDTAGVAVGPTALGITEPDVTDVFTVSLNSRPIAPVTIVLTSSDTSECAAPASVTLDATTWRDGVPVTVTAVDDLISDGAVPCVVETGPVQSADAVYDGLTAADVDVTVNDDEVKAVLVFPTSVSVGEDGTTDTFTVRLNAIPTDTVYVAFAHAGEIQTSGP